MKRLFAILLVCLILCGCSSTAGELLSPVGESQSAPTEATVIPLLPEDVYTEDTAMAVKFEMGAEFEMLLNPYYAVLEVRGLNEAGEALLSSIEPTGSYRNAMETILDVANSQSLLKKETLITITATEVIDDTWHVGCHNILTWPIENYVKTLGKTATFQMYAPGRYFDDSTYLLQNTFTRDDGDHTTTVCYPSSANGPQDMDYCIYDNGDYAEYYYLRDSDETLSCTYFVDGSFSFSRYSPTVYSSYTLTPDGSMWGNSGLRDEEGNDLRTTALYEDGTYFDTYYQNGNIAKDIYIDPNGVRSETIYNENGEPGYHLCEDPNGYRQESEFFENGMRKWTLTHNPDGSYSEQKYYENGMVKHVYTCNADGSADEQHYDENGIPINAPTE